MTRSHTQMAVNPQRGRMHVSISNEGMYLYQGLRLVFTLRAELFGGEVLQTVALQVIAPLPGEQRDIAGVFVNDQATGFEFEGWELCGPPLW